MKTSCLDRDVTGAVKGIALILMFVHHFFTFPSWLMEGISYPWIGDFADAYCQPTAICVAIFAFLTGYFYAPNPHKNLRYSLRKITDLLVSYWVVYLPFLVLAVVLGVHTLTKAGLLYELFGLNTPIMSFCWYIYFYCIVMLLLPLLTKPADRTPGADVLVLLVIPTAVYRFWINQNLQGIGYSVVYNVGLWLPVISSGYLFGKYDLFSRVFDPAMERLGAGWAKVAAALLLCWLAFRGRYYLQSVIFGSMEIRGGRYDLVYPMDMLYAPMFVYGAANLLTRIQGLRKLLKKIGDQSMLMWFLHCIFFNVCKETFQPILYFLRNPILVTLNGLLLCYLAAAVLQPVLKCLLKVKNKLLSPILSR